MAYDFEEHLHNYAIWTSARAVQRGFTTTLNVKRAIESSTLEKFCQNKISCRSHAEFEAFHRECAKRIRASFKKSHVKDGTYGRAAKIISIYLKTAIILPLKGQGKLCTYIHPPIDSILLKNIPGDVNKRWSTIKWTTLKEKQYWQLIDELRNAFKKVDWTLEEYWKPESRT